MRTGGSFRSRRTFALALRGSTARKMFGSGPFVQDLPDTFEFPYRREDADTKDTQEQPYDDHLSRLHMRARLRVPRQLD